MDASTLLSDLRARLKSHEGSYPQIIELGQGLTYTWLTKFAQGTAGNPTVASLQRLSEALDAFEAVAEPAEPRVMAR